MCDLLTSVPHFNFHTNLIAVLVPRMNEKSLDGKVRQHKLSIMNIVIIVFIRINTNESSCVRDKFKHFYI